MHLPILLALLARTVVGSPPQDARPPSEAVDPDCQEISGRSLYQLNDNGGQIALTIEVVTNMCYPTIDERKIVVTAPASGQQLRFSSRTVRKSGELVPDRSRYSVEFPDRSTLELRIGQPVVEPNGDLDYAGCSFSYGGKKLVFTLERPRKPLFTSKEGRAFREALPAEVLETMQLLEDGAGALSEAGAFVGFEELFVDVYLGVESYGRGRKGFDVVELEHTVKRGPARTPAPLSTPGPSDEPKAATPGTISVPVAQPREGPDARLGDQ